MSAPVDFLRRVPLFHGLTDKQLEVLARSFTERSFDAGRELTSEGAGGVGFFVIESGEATVTVDGEERRTLGPGDYFGELALLDGGSRTATITATAPGRAWGLAAWEFRPLVEQNGALAWPLLEQLASRIRELEQRARD
jgi:CRP/FNR family transcriptional regulator, cyclic AMP receptor protein